MIAWWWLIPAVFITATVVLIGLCVIMIAHESEEIAQKLKDEDDGPS